MRQEKADAEDLFVAGVQSSGEIRQLQSLNEQEDTSALFQQADAEHSSWMSGHGFCMTRSGVGTRVCWRTLNDGSFSNVFQGKHSQVVKLF